MRTARNAGSRQALDALLGLAAVFTAVVIPYDFAFPERTALYSGVWVLALRVMFGVDCLLGFFTTVDTFDNQVHVLRRTALAYLRGWFLCDCVAFFPFELLVRGRPEVIRLLLWAKLAKMSLLCAPIGAFCCRFVHLPPARFELAIS